MEFTTNFAKSVRRITDFRCSKHLEGCEPPPPPKKWVVLTPDHELELVTLTDFSVVPLARAAPLPARDAGDFYGFAPLPMRRWRWRGWSESSGPRGRARSRLLGGSSRIRRTLRRARLGRSGGGRHRKRPLGLRGVSRRPTRRTGSGRSSLGKDHRVLLVSRDRRGVKRLSLTSALEQFRPQAPAGWQFRGPNAIVEFLEGIDATGLELAGYYGHWQRQSGIHSQSGAAAEFKKLLELLRHLIAHGQVDVSNLAGAELAARRCLQIQRAVRRSPRHPNFDGLDAMLSSALHETGGVVTSRFDAFVAAEQKDPAAILKQQRLWAGEQQADRKRHGEASRGSDDPGPGKKGGKK